jgi:hypothetical protein
MHQFKLAVNVLTNIFYMCLILGVFVWFNSKIDKMNDMWMSANQVVLQNQYVQIQINSAFNQRLEQFTNHIESMNDQQRQEWFQEYDKNIQTMLYMPPNGLKNQTEL